MTPRLSLGLVLPTREYAASGEVERVVATAVEAECAGVDSV
ncbi:hypothetical protein [Pseudonocardia sp. NPDC049154]